MSCVDIEGLCDKLTPSPSCDMISSSFHWMIVSTNQI